MRSRYLDIDDRTQDLAEQLRDEPSAAEEFLRRYELSWVYHENALEGVVFSGEELAKALSGPPLTDIASLNALRDVRNFKAAIDIVRLEAQNRKPRITLALVRKLYETLHAGIESRQVAEFRKEIPLHRAYFHEIAQPGRIAAQLDTLLEWTDSADYRGFHAVQKASRLQHGFMQIYPYTDGSGKIARLLSNLVLVSSGYQPCIIHTIDRQRYYESLKLPESALRELMIESMENGIASGEKFMREARRQRYARAAR
ncbi:MAG TPA: Fic family protein [Vicinamibacteria bacterium]|jgi:Fic family protein